MIEYVSKLMHVTQTLKAAADIEVPVPVSGFIGDSGSYALSILSSPAYFISPFV
jgi:hypothetical protein